MDTISIILYIIFSAGLGLIVGSFLNVVVLRFNTGKSLNGRSMCFSCGHQLSAHDLVPVFSWLSQKGRCRYCSSKVSPRYIIGEISSMLIFGFFALRSYFSSGIWDFSFEYILTTIGLFVLASILFIIFFYDLDHKIIPDELSFAFGFLGLISLFFFDFSLGYFSYSGFHIPSLIDFLSGLIVPLPFVLVWVFSKGRLIGLGDPKLMVGMGFFLGLSKGFSSVFISFWLGALFALLGFLYNKIRKKTLVSSSKQGIMKQEIPFAPFLILGFVLVFVFGMDIFSY